MKANQQWEVEILGRNRTFEVYGSRNEVRKVLSEYLRVPVSLVDYSQDGLTYAYVRSSKRVVAEITKIEKPEWVLAYEASKAAA